MGRRRPLVGVMGAGAEATDHCNRLAESLRTSIAQRGWALLTGGRPVGVMAAASRSLSNIGWRVPFTGSTIYHFFPADVSYIYQKRVVFFSQCGSTDVEKSIFSSRFGENFAASR